MRSKLHHGNAGFTLVEIMIVIAIIALLATMAVPNYLRARKRSQATAILAEMRLIDHAKDTWAVENNIPGGDPVNWPALLPYFKPGTRLAALADPPVDLIGNEITLSVIDTPPKIHALTRDEFTPEAIEDAESFWGSFTP